MKQGDLKVGVVYGVIPSWDYSSSDKKNPERAQRRDLAKAELVSLNKYAYEVYRSENPDDATFKPAPQGSRSVGYLVKSDSYGANTLYWISRPQDIVAEYTSMEERWVKAEELERLRVEQERKEREDRQRLERELQERADRVAKAVKDSLRTIIGNRVDSIELSSRSKRNDQGEYIPTYRFDLDLSTMQVIVEKVLEARDMVR
jgi:hypothetical protein